MIKNFKTIGFLFISLISSVAFSNEMAMRTEIKANVMGYFMNERFKDLDTIAEQYRTTGERTNSGLWKLTIFYDGFYAMTNASIKDENYWVMLKTKADKWIEETPNSPTAYIAKGIILNRYAWKFRGVSFSHEVPKDAWKPFEDNLKLTLQHMLASKKITENDPHWYALTAKILKESDEYSDFFNKFIDEGLDKFPNYYAIYFAAIDYLVPKWHGDKLQVEEFANRAVTRTKSTEGMGMYTRIYWSASQTQFGYTLFSESNVVWNKMREGIYDIIKKYPDSWNIQNFAFFSCLAKDQKTTRMLFDRMSDPMIIQAWGKSEYYDYCRSFAYPTKALKEPLINRKIL